jgi:hypothetical protein
MRLNKNVLPQSERFAVGILAGPTSIPAPFHKDLSGKHQVKPVEALPFYAYQV